MTAAIKREDEKDTSKLINYLKCVFYKNSHHKKKNSTYKV